MTTAGSSPLARGGRRVDPVRAQVVGLIPARAGRTHRRSSAPETTTAHPRSRGADWPPVSGTSTTWGSSPLARGGLLARLHRTQRGRLIPARAGRTWATRARRASCGAHPRSRGADANVWAGYLIFGGSSPLARGGLLGAGRGRQGRGLIPARAGRTPAATHRRPRPSAHPRSRGADQLHHVLPHGGRGSSPLARGGRHDAGRVCAELGLIPARAGRTPPQPQRPHPPQAHPRSRGADSGGTSTGGAEPGSSPLARGGPGGHRRQGSDGRLIPARAGRTFTDENGWAQGAAHPRSRGADEDGSRDTSLVTGSSPLARGGRMPLNRRTHERGLIPARAGRTVAPRP